MIREWIECRKELPPKDKTVMTKIDNAGGCHNEQSLRRGGENGRLWFFPDMSMYVYYEPTHWLKESP